MATVATPETQETSGVSRTFASPPGLVGFLTSVTHKQVGQRYMALSFLFFLLGGIQALLLRTQLAVPANDVLDPQLYNALFTMHGSTMMYLFVVPFVEGLGNYFLPLILGARDLPFPRLNAFNFWMYAFGGLIVYSSFFFAVVPTGGWYGYPPLTLTEFLPGAGIDFWLTGITLAEISAIGAATELVVVLIKQRAPGMSLNRIPIIAWAVFLSALMIIFAFAVLLAGSILLELDRKVGTHFFDAAAGGDPVLWQHLFWGFGHPEVYVMFLPAAGVVSAVVQTFSRRPLVGYRLVVLSLVATAFLSFGLWVHHMFTVGIPLISLGIFAAASYMIAIPSGVQTFAWIATLWRGSVRAQVPLLFVLGGVVTFVLGGITGVMVATVPFDWQVHDSYFLIAHFHYVLIGGVVFPFFAAIYYWLPKVTGRLLDERLGSWSFWVMFIGFNVTFFPMHITGLLGMPRRVYTYPAGLGWDIYNLVSTIGAFVLAVGVLLTVVAIVRSRRGPSAGDNPWGGDGLEWATTSPPSNENFRVIPLVQTATPLWDSAPENGDERARDVVHALAHEPSAWRATLGTTPADARPSELIYFPGPTITPLVAATGLFIVGVGVLSDLLLVIGVGLLVAVVAGALWVWSAERDRHADASGFELVGLPVDVTGSRAVGWWGLLLLLGAGVSVLATVVFSYFFLAIKAPQWPPADSALPSLALGAVLAAALLATAVATSVGAALAGRASGVARGVALTVALALGAATAVVHAGAIDAAPTRFDANAYGSLLAAFHGLGALTAVLGVGFTALALAASVRHGGGARLRLLTGNAGLFWWFGLVAWLVSFASAYVSPRLG